MNLFRIMNSFNFTQHIQVASTPLSIENNKFFGCRNIRNTFDSIRVIPETSKEFSWMVYSLYMIYLYLLRMRWSCSPKHVMIPEINLKSWKFLWFKVEKNSKFVPQLVLSFALKITLLRTNISQLAAGTFESMIFPNFPVGYVQPQVFITQRCLKANELVIIS